MAFDRQGTVASPSGAKIKLYSAAAIGAPIGVIQINHGLAEHAARYAAFAKSLAEAGFHVFAHDHRGHGWTSAPDARAGLFAAHGGADKVIADVEAIHALIAERHPGLPVITFGHSMGGLIALNHAMAHPDRAAGLAVWNANFSAGLLGRVGQLLLRIERMRLGHDVPSRIFPKLTFQAWAKSVPNRRTDFDWLSHLPEEVDAYVDDPLCGWDASVQMCLDVLDLVFRGADDANLSRLRRDLPINLHGGGEDPATEKGKAVSALADRLKALNFNIVATKIDPGGRHETLNDRGRAAAISAFAQWATQALKDN